jgi:hypothetical protein
VPLATDTAERVYDVSAPAYAVAQPSAAPSPGPAPSGAAYQPPARHSHRAGPGLWIAAAAALVVVLVAGGFLLLHGGGDTGGAASSAPIVRRHHSPGPSSDTSAGSGSPSSTSSSSTTPSTTVKGPPTNVAGLARASAPRHAPAGVDFAGRPVTYVAENMVDGRNDTCWRTPGAATGTLLTFRLDQPTRLLRVGLVNGYSKIAYSGGRSFDWYHGNRRVLSVQWVFDDGSSVTQHLGFDRDLQQTPIKPVTTQTVRLRILSVSAPGKGRAARNDTAISEVFLLGKAG